MIEVTINIGESEPRLEVEHKPSVPSGQSEPIEAKPVSVWHPFPDVLHVPDGYKVLAKTSGSQPFVWLWSGPIEVRRDGEESYCFVNDIP